MCCVMPAMNTKKLCALFVEETAIRAIIKQETQQHKIPVGMLCLEKVPEPALMRL